MCAARGAVGTGCRLDQPELRCGAGSPQRGGRSLGDALESGDETGRVSGERDPVDISVHHGGLGTHDPTQTFRRAGQWREQRREEGREPPVPIRGVHRSGGEQGRRGGHPDLPSLQPSEEMRDRSLHLDSTESIEQSGGDDQRWPLLPLTGDQGVRGR